MSIRIYALSKQLNVDSKEILDAIKQLGIEGIGSSLAGLTEEEVELVKKKLNNPEYIEPISEYNERQQKYEEYLRRDREAEKKRSEERQRRPVRIGDLADKYEISPSDAIKVCQDCQKAGRIEKRSYPLDENDTLTKEEAEHVEEKLKEYMDAKSKRAFRVRATIVRTGNDGITRPQF